MTFVSCGACEHVSERVESTDRVVGQLLKNPIFDHVVCLQL